MNEIPALRATYRLQLNAAFDFGAAVTIVPYLASLGVSHLYLSPIWAARPGSTHGYDVVDHNAINPELGGPEGFDALVEAARAHDLGLILDCVPNHMGIGYANPWWADVLTWGEASPHATYFDIDWDPAEPTLKGKVLLPILGDHYGRVLEDGDLRPDLEDGRFLVRYHEHKVPLHPRETGLLLEAAAAEARNRQASDAGDTLSELAGIAKLIARPRQRVSRQRHRADRDRSRQIEQRLGQAQREDPAVASAMQAALALLRPGADGHDDGKAADRLHRLLERQAYRLAFWRLASSEINYRRFFDINDLAGLRMEDPALFDVAHKSVAQLATTGRIQGIRLDHIDGLFDPRAYLGRLRRATRNADAEAHTFTLHVEKILGHDEPLRRDWPVEGTTGYEVMNLIHGVQVEAQAEDALLTLYGELTGGAARFEREAVRAKRLIMATSLGAELNVLAGQLNRIAKRSRYTRDYARQALRDALADVIAYFPVYRTYVDGRGANDTDRAIIQHAIEGAKHTATTPDLSIYDFIGAVLTTAAARGVARATRPAEIIRFARRFQQYTGPVTAKAVEDTAFYRWLPLVSLNEVGGEPAHFGVTADAFHAANRERLRDWPLALCATSTHDHKRGEDVRARLAGLSEHPHAWGRAVRRWFRLAEPLVSTTPDGPAPSPNDRYLFFQTVVGAWPLDVDVVDDDGLRTFRERMLRYMEKAVREAKAETSWAVVHPTYEAAVHDFVEAALDPAQSPRLLKEMRSFASGIETTGAVNGLVQTTLKLTIPGVPDIYQGTEGWDLSLVDPDNRRPVDYARHAAALDDWRGDGSDFDAVANDWPDGRVKQMLIARILSCRKQHPDLFRDGDYRPLRATGDAAEQVLAFARVRGRRALVVAVARLAADRLIDPGQLQLDWGDTTLDFGRLVGRRARWTDVLHGRELSVAGGVGLDLVAKAPPILVALGDAS